MGPHTFGNQTVRDNNITYPIPLLETNKREVTEDPFDLWGCFLGSGGKKFVLCCSALCWESLAQHHGQREAGTDRPTLDPEVQGTFLFSHCPRRRHRPP